MNRPFAITGEYNPDVGNLPLGHHTLGIECKGVLSTGVDRMLARNRVGVDLTRSTISSFDPFFNFPPRDLKKLSSW